MKSFVLIHPKDSVLIALKDMGEGDKIKDVELGFDFILKENVTRGSKIANRDMNKFDVVFKYGYPIGQLTEDVRQGEIVHVHNIKTLLSEEGDYVYKPEFNKVNVTLPERSIKAYTRDNGEIGIRNELWIIPTVGCVNATARQIIKTFEREVDTSVIDGVHLFSHNYGCSQLGDDHENTRKILADMVNHPNAGAVLVIGLGCENNQIDAFKELVSPYNESRVKFMAAQRVEDEIEQGVSLMKDLFNYMKDFKREEHSIGKLKVGLECGGSDGLSGITANPLLGQFSDYLINYGGTSVLTEVPEMFGAEEILFSRCDSKEVFNDAVDMINDFKHYFVKNEQPIYENPSPGNKQGGISTLEDKSLGCTQKAGDSNVVDVLKYGEVLKKPGLNLLSAPGNDAVATSALAAAGCHLVLFTTGRGTPLGGSVPTLKISTNSDLANRKKHWIDFNAGSLVEDKNMDDLLIDFIDLVQDVASGKESKNEINDFRELVIFKSGVTL